MPPVVSAVAQGSEQISTRWVEGAKRECVKCGRPIKNLQRDVGHVRTRFPGAVREIICMDCHLGRSETPPSP